ncbi:DUF1330 domain-containing protein [Aureibacter tunicatorum]|uniref:Uncharacterized protein (DUF1330 family) n=1 Tax=Aureibacter tunicatorum TaxID=866807 RepID=A0AAE3XSU8_9BACT|nr:DUF1330 domain-containing protein [Aureibacter tunicatorum]MDR6241380.1 uncharacterized protein (DUF1330 family) [Aureibacter tunicatorum]BDD06775.1 hypothetical protein AUTU_42580 [Aureibacter tunicatorum]
MNHQQTTVAKPAYMIAFVRIEDHESFNEIYLNHAIAIVEKYGGKTFAMAENPPSLEGEIPKGRLVILEFPSKENAYGFYNDPEYQPLKKARHKISDSDSVIIERFY